MLDKPLLHRIKVLESMWSVDKNCVLINLEKTKEIMWKSVLEGEKGIDMSKIDNTRPMSDFDAEAQAAIERVTYDQHMKMLGKPTSGEQVGSNHSSNTIFTLNISFYLFSLSLSAESA